MPALHKLNEKWEFDVSLNILELELKEPIRKDLAKELDGTETPEEIARLVLRLVRERT